LHIYLAYYYFNLAKHNGWDLPRARAEAEQALRHWDALPTSEHRTIVHERARAYGIACFLVANELQKRGDRVTAASFLKQGVRIVPSAIIRPAGIYPLMKQAVGPAVAVKIDRLTDRLISVYRNRRFDYRYHKRNRNGAS